MNLLELHQQNGFQARRVAASHGGEYKSPCPDCGGIDRFIVWPETGRYWCRGCGKSGDALQYLRDYRGMSFKASCNLLNLSDKLKRPAGPRPMQAIEPKKEPWQPRTVTEPGAQWQAAAENFIQKSMSDLQANPAALQYLFDRGLNVETITAARIGWNPKTFYIPRHTWGLAVNKEKTGGQKIFIPAGQGIPNGTPGALHGIKIRISNRQENQPKYYNLPGSNTAPFILGSIPILFIVESELDALLIYQEAKDLVAVAAMGSAKNTPCVDTVNIFKNALALFIALDTDSAGIQGAAWWLKNFNTAIRWPVPVGKDPTEARQHGLNIRAWVAAGIESAGWIHGKL